MTQIIRRAAAAAALASFSFSPALAQQAPPMPTPDPTPAPAAPAPPGAQAATYLPRYQLKAGPGLPYEMVIAYNGTTQVGEQSVPLKLREQFLLKQGYANIAPDGSQADMSLQFTSLMVTVNGHEKSLGGDELADLQAASPKIRMRSDGTIAGMSATGQVAAGAPQGMQGAILPPTAVPIGGEWHSSFVVQGQKFNGRYVLASVAPDAKGDQVMTVNITLMAQSEPGGHLLPTLGRMYMSGHGQGQLHFDNTLGVLRDSRLTMSAVMNTQPRQPGQKPVHTAFTMNMSWQYAPVIYNVVVHQGSPTPTMAPPPAAPVPAPSPVPVPPGAAMKPLRPVLPA